MQYQVCIKKTEEGYAVWCPSLPGCASQGITKEEALENIQDAIISYLELALRKNLPLATNDNRLIEAAKRCQVRLMEV